MYNNNENAMVEKKNFMLPEMLEGEFTSEELADDYDGLQLSFQRVKIPAGGALQFEIPGDDPENPDYTKYIEGVILHSHQTGAYWPEGSEYDDSVTPLCSSVDGKIGCGTPGGSCALCELNQYGTATDSKGNQAKGKACKNMRHLYILRDGEYMPILLALPPTSLRPYSDFINACFVTRRRPTYASVVQIGLKRIEGANTYSVATFKKVCDFTGEELAKVKAYATGFREQIKGMLVERLRIPADELEYDSELFGEDIGLDSIDSIEIIVGIENLFGVDISGAGATREDFRSIETLTAFVEAHKED